MATATLNPNAALTRTHDALARAVVPAHARWTIDVADVQGLVLRGYGTLPACAYQLLRIEAADKARKWLRGLVERVASGLPGAREEALQIAFTHAGLAALGLWDDALVGFSRQFIEGMVGPHRSRFLGDIDESAPEHWRWGGPNTPPVHVMLMHFAKDDARLTHALDDARRGLSGLSEVTTLATASLSRTEHFGFADGISQPAIDGYHTGAPSLHLVKAGEFLLGYPNEYGQLTERPLLAESRDPRGTLPLDVAGTPRRDLGRNGSYLVFRQLRQDVAAFRETIDRLTRREDGSADPRAQAELAAKMVGRWPSGASLVEAPYADEVSKAHTNDFRYHGADPEGLMCPIGAHVRRANPRDALAPRPGTDDSLEVNRRHRLIRRGRIYGPQLAPGARDDADRGIMFMAVNANITRQFEFIQHSWIADVRFNGMQGEADPIMGTTTDNHFSIPMNPVRKRCTGLPRFVTVAGGAYFFLPGIRALRFLGELTP